MISRRAFLLAGCAAVAFSAEMAFSAEDDVALLSLSAASDRVRKKAVSPVELVKGCLQRIERLNPGLNAYITVTAEAALSRARELEADVQRGRWRGPLHGVP